MALKYKGTGNEEKVEVHLTIAGRMLPSAVAALKRLLADEEVAITEGVAPTQTELYLTPAQARLLRVLAATEGAMPSTELGKKAGVKDNSLRALLSHLARLGLVERNRGLTGPTFWRITEAGRQALAETS